MIKKTTYHMLTKKDIGKLLDEQTGTILSAVDDRLKKSKIEILSAVDQRFEKFEARFNKKLDHLTTTLDRFLKRLTDAEDEFIIMKKDINQVKAVLKEKLGVDLF